MSMCRVVNSLTDAASVSRNRSLAGVGTTRPVCGKDRYGRHAPGRTGEAIRECAEKIANFGPSVARHAHCFRPPAVSHFGPKAPHRNGKAAGGRMPAKPLWMWIDPTRECGLKCHFCYTKRSHGSDHLTPDTLRRILDI